jgi:hypothetical protein
MGNLNYQSFCGQYNEKEKFDKNCIALMNMDYDSQKKKQQQQQKEKPKEKSDSSSVHLTDRITIMRTPAPVMSATTAATTTAISAGDKGDTGDTGDNTELMGIL